jgi:hypothetical protein
LRQAVLVVEQRPAADLADDEIEHPGVAEVGGHDAATIAVVVRAGEVADVEEVAAADVEIDAVPLEGAEVVPLVDDRPRIADPELVELGIESAGLFDIAVPVARL